MLRELKQIVQLQYVAHTGRFARQRQAHVDIGHVDLNVGIAQCCWQELAFEAQAIRQPMH